MSFTYSFEKLEIWKLGIELSKAVYVLTKDFPDYEKFGITNQLRRASNSISANIAEGTSRKSDKDKARFIEIAFTSLMEVLSFLKLSLELKFISTNQNQELRTLIEELGNKINSYHNHLYNKL